MTTNTNGKAPAPVKTQGAMNMHTQIIPETQAEINEPVRIPLNVYQGVRNRRPIYTTTKTRREMVALLSKPEVVRDKFDAKTFTLVATEDNRGERGDKAVTAVHAVVGDIDHGFDQAKFDQAWAALERNGAWAVAYQTFSSKPDAQRWRVVLFLDVPIEPSRYDQWWRALNYLFDGMLDTGAKDVSRLSFVCSHPQGETREIRILRGGE